MPKSKHEGVDFYVYNWDIIKLCDADELKLYLYLKLYAINKHESWPSHATIREETGFERRKLIDIIKKMEDKRRLKVTRRAGGHNIYDFSWYDQINERKPITKSALPKEETNYKISTAIITKSAPERRKTNDEILSKDKIDNIIKYYEQKHNELKGFKPRGAWSALKHVRGFVSSNSASEGYQLIDWFLTSDDYKFSPTIFNCFSSRMVNKWRLSRVEASRPRVKVLPSGVEIIYA